MMQTRFEDGGVGVTRGLAPQDFLGKPDAVSWAPGKYFVLGTSGTPRSVASNLDTQAGMTVHGSDGGSLAFAQVNAVTRSTTMVPILAGVGDASARVLWDPTARLWHVVYAVARAGFLWLASFSESGAKVRDITLSCSVQGDVVRVVLDQRSMFVGYQTNQHGVLRVDL